jgi:hypothetical protein
MGPVYLYFDIFFDVKDCGFRSLFVELTGKCTGDFISVSPFFFFFPVLSPECREETKCFRLESTKEKRLRGCMRTSRAITIGPLVKGRRSD